MNALEGSENELLADDVVELAFELLLCLTGDKEEGIVNVNLFRSFLGPSFSTTAFGEPPTACFFTASEILGFTSLTFLLGVLSLTCSVSATSFEVLLVPLLVFSRIRSFPFTLMAATGDDMPVFRLSCCCFCRSIVALVIRIRGVTAVEIILRFARELRIAFATEVLVVNSKAGNFPFAIGVFGADVSMLEEEDEELLAREGCSLIC